MCGAAVLALLGTTAANAKSTPLHIVKYWSTYYVVGSDNSPMCTIAGSWTFKTGAQSHFYMKFTNENGLFINLGKANWRFEENLDVPLAIWFDKSSREGTGKTMK